MMSWIGILVVSPLWGMISTQMFVQSWLGVVLAGIGIIGAVAGRRPRQDCAILVAIGLAQALIFSTIIIGVNWILTSVTPFGTTMGEIISYWIFAAISAPYLLVQVPGKIKDAWRRALVPA
mgnify:CR=1 FL=1